MIGQRKEIHNKITIFHTQNTIKQIKVKENACICYIKSFCVKKCDVPEVDSVRIACVLLYVPPIPYISQSQR